MAVTDANRNVVQRSEYEPFGKLVNRAMQDGPGFTGHVEDAATGLGYFQQRYFDTDNWRFLSVDPVTAYATPGSNFNRYWYANNKGATLVRTFAASPFVYTVAPSNGHDLCKLPKKKRDEIDALLMAMAGEKPE